MVTTTELYSWWWWCRIHRMHQLLFMFDLVKRMYHCATIKLRVCVISADIDFCNFKIEFGIIAPSSGFQQGSTKLSRVYVWYVRYSVLRLPHPFQKDRNSPLACVVLYYLHFLFQIVIVMIVGERNRKKESKFSFLYLINDNGFIICFT